MLLLLHNGRSSPDLGASHEGANLQCNQLTAALLAVDGEIEQCSVPGPRFAIEKGSSGRNLFLRERSFGPDFPAGVPRCSILHYRNRLRVAYCISPWPRIGQLSNAIALDLTHILWQFAGGAVGARYDRNWAAKLPSFERRIAHEGKGESISRGQPKKVFGKGVLWGY